MDLAEIARLVEELKITKEATEDQIELSPNLTGITQEKASKCLIGKIFATRVVNREALRSQLPRILQAHRDIEVEIVGDNLFVVSFSSQTERRNALLNGPWHFSNSLMVFKEVRGLQKPSEVCFDVFSSWIQLHNLPIVCMNPAIVREIGEKLGSVDEIDLGDDGNCVGMFARVRVTRPIDTPLRRCVSLCVGNIAEPALILLRYERLPDFCYACGRVTHTIRFCKDEGANKSNPQFGAWMKAGRTQEARRARFMSQNEANSSSSNQSQQDSQGKRALEVKGSDSSHSESVKSKETNNFEASGNDGCSLNEEDVRGREMLPLIHGKEAEQVQQGAHIDSLPMEMAFSTGLQFTSERKKQTPGQNWKKRARSGKTVGRATENPVSSSPKRKLSSDS